MYIHHVFSEIMSSNAEVQLRTEAAGYQSVQMIRGKSGGPRSRWRRDPRQRQESHTPGLWLRLHGGLTCYSDPWSCPETKWAVQPFTAYIDSCMLIQTEPHKWLIWNALHKHTAIRWNIKYTNISTYYICFFLSRGILGFAFPMKYKNFKGYTVKK